MNRTVVLISALQKNSAFQDDLLRKLAGKSLLERSVEKARLFGVANSDIHVYTDSETVGLSAERVGVNVYLDPDLSTAARVAQEKFHEYVKFSIA